MDIDSEKLNIINSRIQNHLQAAIGLFVHDNNHNISHLKMCTARLFYILNKLEIEVPHLNSIEKDISKIIEDLNSNFNEINYLFRGIHYEKEFNQLTQVDLKKVITNVLEVFKTNYYNLKIDFLFDKKTNYIIRGNKSHIELCVIELLKNSSFASSPSKALEISIELRHENSKFIVRIEDNGNGIDKYELENLIFNQGYTTKHNNSGLGLTITKWIMESHFGEIKIESTKNQGTTVLLFFNENGEN